MNDEPCRDAGQPLGCPVVPQSLLDEARAVAWALRDYLQDADPEHPGLRQMLEMCGWLSDEAEYRRFCQGLDAAVGECRDD